MCCMEVAQHKLHDRFTCQHKARHITTKVTCYFPPSKCWPCCSNNIGMGPGRSFMRATDIRHWVQCRRFYRHYIVFIVDMSRLPIAERNTVTPATCKVSNVYHSQQSSHPSNNRKDQPACIKEIRHCQCVTVLGVVSGIVQKSSTWVLLTAYVQMYR